MRSSLKMSVPDPAGLCPEIQVSHTSQGSHVMKWCLTACSWLAVMATSCGTPASLLAETGAASGKKSAGELPRIDQRYAKADVGESPDFRQHVIPLMGKLGCNGRACHGSFQGQGGFRLSLFGYDFKSDHDNIAGGDEPRVNLKDVDESLILQKALTLIDHEGGKRFDADTWQHRVLRKWVADGAKPMPGDAVDFVRLEITPAEMIAKQKGDTWQLKAVAIWSDGSTEDVTPLCRFQSNDDQVATITESGLVTSTGPGDTHVVAFYDNGVVPTPVMHPVSNQVGPKYPQIATPTKIDQHVVNKLRKLGLVQAETCTDTEFLRRVSLDIIGTLPTPTEVQAFLNDSSQDKRARKIDELLERPEYAAWWATKLADWTGNNSRYQQNGIVPRDDVAREWYDWLHKRVQENMPYDTIAEGMILATSRQEDESYEDFCQRMSSYYHKGTKETVADQATMPHYWSRTNFRQVDDRALGFAYSFLGVRIQCAQCHKHPFDQWTKDDFDRFKGFFARVQYGTAPGARDTEKSMLAALDVNKKLMGNQLQRAVGQELKDGKVVPFKEVFVPEVKKVNNRAAKADKNKKRPQVVAGRTAKVLGGDEIQIDELDDPRTAVMDWMRDDNNPYFSQAFVNRVWAGYFNRGIVEPTDDLSLANPPCNAELLDYLSTAFREHNYDMKWLHREICNSRTYQLSWQANETNQLDERNFSRAVPRRLPAEVAYDAVVQSAASNQELDATRGELKNRAIAEPIVTAGNNGRGISGYALTVFGRSIRESNCDCDRSAETSLLQTVYLQNDSQVLSELTARGSWVGEVLKAGSDSGADAKLATAVRSLERLEKQVKRAEKQGNKQRLAELQKSLTAAKKEAAALKKISTTPTEVPADDEKLTEIVRQAYLRTLSRYPTDAELGRSVSYFQETDDLQVATRDLLWALLNTKEFIVNH